jgi:crotonobetainyl-CoA:carnitine CoA-transferase CaiB-like acyl-CoA transferase
MSVYDGIRVVELATGIAGPYASMFLADNGADVVKIEPSGGDPYRADPGFQTVNRNKRSIIDDDPLASPDGRRLLAAADVIIVAGPGQGPALRALNPSAVIVTMPPWGERGPMVDAPTSRSLLHAATGIAWNQQSYAEVPVDVVVPIASYGTGVLGALAATAGLLVRTQRGAVVTYEVSEVAGAAAIQVGESRPPGEPELRPGDSGLGSKGRVACYRLIEAQDGKWLFLACGTARFYQRMLDVIGRPDLLDDPLLANPPWGLMLDGAIERLTPILDEVFATRPRDEWLRLLGEADVPAQPVLSRDEFLQTSIVAANEMDVSIDHPELGPVQMMGLPFTIESAPGSIRRPAPLLGQHDDEVRAELLAGRAGGGDPESPMPPPGPPNAATGDASAELPLTGLRVIDLASFIAGPVVSRHLAMLGAEVIKVEPPTGDPFRAIGPLFVSWNQGKRSIAIDLTTPDGQALLRRLVADADVVVENFRPGVAARLGADRATLAAVNPDLVFLSSPGYGIDDAMADRPAFDPLVQALGGFMAAQGGLVPDGSDQEPGGSEPVFLSVAIHDVMTPMLGALGLVMALWQRHRTGEGQHVRTSLAQSTMVAQAAEYTRFAGRPPTALGGFDHPGPDNQHTWTETDDGELIWVDGRHSVAVCRVGLTGSELAEANGLLTTGDHPEHGPLVLFGQLIGGAGPPPFLAPVLDADGDAIRAELDRHHRPDTK